MGNNGPKNRGKNGTDDNVNLNNKISKDSNKNWHRKKKTLLFTTP